MTPSPRVRVIFIIGLRGSGKSTIGPQLAGQFENTAFIDLDALVRARFPEATVQEIWHQHGESAWRDAELQAISEVLDTHATQSTGLVLALGGGAPMIPAVREIMKQQVESNRAYIIYLRCSPDILQARLANEQGHDDRPPLTDKNDTLAEVAEVYRRRDPTYTNLATHVVDIPADQSIDRTMELIMRSLS